MADSSPLPNEVDQEIRKIAEKPFTERTKAEMVKFALHTARQIKIRPPSELPSGKQ